MKKLIGAAVGVGMLLATVTPSFAYVVTGPGSVNVNAKVNLKLLSVTNTNFAFVSYDVVSVSSTGGNSADGNTIGGVVKSGDSTSYTYIYNIVNSNVTRIRM